MATLVGTSETNPAEAALKLSIIIPTYNEEAILGQLLQYVRQHLSGRAEVIVADGGSTDATTSLAQQQHAVVLQCKSRGRAAQMNEAAAVATGDVLYFLHADTFPPAAFAEQIRQAVQAGYGSGCFRLRFDKANWFLKANAWFTRFDVDAIRFGDQSLFVRKEVFWQIGGFSTAHLLLEDQEIIKRLRKVAPFKVLPAAVTTSARKYREHGAFRLQGIYYLIYSLYRLGVPQQQLVNIYKKLLRQP